MCQHVLLCGTRGGLPGYSLPGGIVTLYYRPLRITIAGARRHITVRVMENLDTGVYPDIRVAVSIASTTNYTLFTRVSTRRVERGRTYVPILPPLDTLPVPMLSNLDDASG